MRADVADSERRAAGKQVVDQRAHHLGSPTRCQERHPLILEVAELVGEQVAHVRRRAHQRRSEAVAAAHSGHRRGEKLAEHGELRRRGAMPFAARALLLGQGEPAADRLRQPVEDVSQVRPLHPADRGDLPLVGALPLAEFHEQVVAEHPLGWHVPLLRDGVTPVPEFAGDREFPPGETVEPRDPPPPLATKRLLDVVLPGGHLLLHPVAAAERFELPFHRPPELLEVPDIVDRVFELGLRERPLPPVGPRLSLVGREVEKVADDRGVAGGKVVVNQASGQLHVKER